MVKVRKAGVAAIAVLLVAGSACSSPDSQDALPRASAASSSPTTSVSTSAGPLVIPDGRYTVGVDFAAGEYSADPAGSCYWARYDSAGDILDNSSTDATRVEVTVELSDASFSSRGCGGWTQLSVADPESPADDKTSCAVYRRVYDDADRQDSVEPFLVRLREEKKITPAPAEKLIQRFAKQVFQVCGSSTWVDDPDSTVGYASKAVFEVYKEYSK